MEIPVQDIAMNGIVEAPPAKQNKTQEQGKTPPKDMSTTTHHVMPNRAIAPVALLAFLVLCFIFSPYLPTGLREYISALVR